MKTKMAYKAIKNMVFSAIVLMPLQLNTGALPSDNLRLELPSAESTQIQEEVPPSAQPKVVLLDLEGKYCDTNVSCFLKERKDTIKFMSDTFAIDEEVIMNDLTVINENVIYDEFNIGRLKDSKGNLKEYKSFEEGLIEYMFSFAKKNPKQVSNKRDPYTGSKDYVIDLIKYFTGIYENVDYTTAVSIGAAESGYYEVTYMLKCNNVFGGMSSSGLIKYKNIEYGVLNYIRMLSRSYYGKGLKTLESIGRIYCPTYDSNGNKIASPHWLKLVKTAMNKYKGTYEEVDVIELLKD
ncbi:MAG TPA: hypothetical protein DCY94_03340 [Firmicutes bacterium]|nr:hypothetical protein [Bacillota bacterium]